MRTKFIVITCLLFLLSQLIVNGQISQKGIPASILLNFNNEYQSIVVENDNRRMIKDNIDSDKNLSPFQIGYTLPLDVNLNNSGTFFELDSDLRVWKLKIQSEGAEALSLYFDLFYLPEGVEMYIYNTDAKQILGAFSHHNNSDYGYFATELIEGDNLTVELNFGKEKQKDIKLNISELAFIYRNSGFSKTERGFGGSGDCEVNVNCPEGDNWQNEKRGIARVLVKDGGSISWCSGSLINNTEFDFTPYFFTANHCGRYASAESYQQWVFYFNYESADCENPEDEPEYNSMTGADLIASSLFGTSLGSDFKLLRLNESVPESYNPYFNGWSRQGVNSPNGIGIHHPQGDIKKISTYTDPLMSALYNTNTENADAMYWRVVWSETETNHGVTEGGSSGSPIFDAEGRIIGALTGGQASCSYLTSPDYYGKLSYSWESNGDADTIQLKPWLDPQSKNQDKISGIGYNEELFSASFNVDTTVIPLEATLNFTDISLGDPDEWEWIFEGAFPETSNEQSPQGIQYNQSGTFDVRLVINKGNRTDTLHMENYIKVVSKWSLIPELDMINVYLGVSPVESVSFDLFDLSGLKVKDYGQKFGVKSVQLNIEPNWKGLYILRINIMGKMEMHKIFIY